MSGGEAKILDEIEKKWGKSRKNGDPSPPLERIVGGGIFGAKDFPRTFEDRGGGERKIGAPPPPPGGGESCTMVCDNSAY